MENKLEQLWNKLKHCWWNINRRCNNPNSKDYKYYGGRGIKGEGAGRIFTQFN